MVNLKHFKRICAICASKIHKLGENHLDMIVSKWVYLFDNQPVNQKIRIEEPNRCTL